MRISRSSESGDRPVSTADLAAAAQRSNVVEDDEQLSDDGGTLEAAPADEEELVALFAPDMTEKYRSQWLAIQSSFVDDPRQAVRRGDELVAQVMTDLANSFADERHRLEARLDETGEGSTESLRVALRRYRSFFNRLLAM